MKRFIGILTILMLVSACREGSNDPGPPDGEECLFSDSLGSIIPSPSVDVHADSQAWQDSGISVSAGESVTIRSGGNVDLCRGNWIHESSALDPTNTAHASDWRGTGHRIPVGNEFTISVDGWWKTNSWMPTSFNGFGVGNWEYGERIYARLGEAADIAAETYEDRRIPAIAEYANPVLLPEPTHGRQRASLLHPGTIGGTPRPGKRMFELFDYTTGVGGFYFNPANQEETHRAWHGYTQADYTILGEFPVPIDKEVFLRFSHQGGAGDNRAGNSLDASSWVYFTISYLDNCPGFDGKFMRFQIAGSQPAIGDENGTDLHEYATTTGGVHTFTAPNDGNLWFKIIDNVSIDWGDGAGQGDSDYSPFSTIPPPHGTGSNWGSYSVSITVDSSGFTDVINTMIDPIKTLLQGDVDIVSGLRTGGITRDVYVALTSDAGFLNAIRNVLALSVVIFGFVYMLGLANITQSELFSHIFKMAIVIILLSDTSWTFFYNYLFAFFIDGTDNLINNVSGQFMTVINPSGGNAPPTLTSADGKTFAFDFLNQTMQRYFSKESGIKIEALFFSSFLGFFLAILIYIGIFLFVIAILKAVIVYILSIIMVSLLLFLAPIFLLFILFNKTKGLFDNWIKNLISYSLQPVMLFSVLAIFNAFIFSAFYNVLAFDVCWGCLIRIDFPINEIIFQNFLYDFDAFCLLYGYRPWSLSGGMDADVEFSKNPVALFLVFIFVIFCSAMLRFVDWVRMMGNQLTAGGAGTDLGNAANTAISEATQFTKHTASMTGHVVKPGLKIIDAASALTGQRISDRYIRAKRRALKIVGGRSGWNPLVDVKGGSDGRGGQLRYKKELMTSKEKRYQKFQEKRFNSLTKEEQKKERLSNMKKQLDYDDKKKDIRAGTSRFSTGGRSALRIDKWGDDRKQQFKSARKEFGTAGVKEFSKGEYYSQKKMLKRAVKHREAVKRGKRIRDGAKVIKKSYERVDKYIRNATKVAANASKAVKNRFKKDAKIDAKTKKDSKKDDKK